VKLGIVVQRYGADINGGAEQHARFVAEHLARHHEVEVLTTCARDYITWRNELPAGLDTVHGVAVRRFPVRRERRPAEFGRWSRRVFDTTHSTADELAWLASEGPASPALVSYVRRRRADYDFLVFFSYRYHHAYHGARAAGGRAVLVPTAERDPAIGVDLFGPLFRGVRGIMYNSLEEQAMIQAAADNASVPSVVVGVGSEVPDRPSAERFRRKHGLERRFAVYVGRIDENKGCPELFAHFTSYASAFPRGLDLVLVGGTVIPVPDHPRIRHLGFLPDEDKFDAIAAADLLIMPSYFESLSMAVLEAWAIGRPVLVNGRCDVLRGQCLRSGAGLYYETREEFVETLYALESNGPLNGPFGRNGQTFYERHYAWPVIERKYDGMLERLAEDDRAGRAAPGMAALPGWWARRRRTLPPAAEVLERLPTGPAVPASRAPQPTAAPAPRPDQGRTDQRRTDQRRTDQGRTGQARTSQARTGGRSHQDRRGRRPRRRPS
jgi:glycosyltransferase involved in cell wall biosynthesis